MDEGDGLNGPGAGHSRYTESLMQVISDYVASHPQIDPHRVHLMGCSNGGYMTLNMALHYPDYFAGLVPQATAYSYYEFQRLDNGHYLIKDPKKRGSIQAYAPTQRVWFDQDKVAALKNQAIWFVHSLDDPTVPANAYVLPIYKDLVDAGGQNVWLSLFQLGARPRPRLTCAIPAISPGFPSSISRSRACKTRKPFAKVQA